MEQCSWCFYWLFIQYIYLQNKKLTAFPAFLCPLDLLPSDTQWYSIYRNKTWQSINRQAYSSVCRGRLVDSSSPANKHSSPYITAGGAGVPVNVYVSIVPRRRLRLSRTSSRPRGAIDRQSWRACGPAGRHNLWKHKHPDEVNTDGGGDGAVVGDIRHRSRHDKLVPLNHSTSSPKFVTSAQRTLTNTIRYTIRYIYMRSTADGRASLI